MWKLENSLETTYRLENCQDFCLAHIRRQEFFLFHPSKIQIASPNFCVEA